MTQPWLRGAVLALLAAGTLWLSRAIERWGTAAPSASHEIDFYATDFVARAMDAQGLPDRELSASRLERHAATGSESLDSPTLRFGLGRPAAWELTAERAWVSPNGDTVRLSGEVRLRCDGVGSSGPLEVFTREVTVHPQSERAETDLPARIVGRGWEATGVGLRASLPERRVELLSQVRTRHDPQVR
jgi:lipopolysaccharide export system protein LptC